MTEIELYQPGKFYANIVFPTSWNELTAPELKFMAKAIQENDTKQNILIFLISNRAADQQIRLPKDWTKLLDFETAAIDGLPLVDIFLEENNLTQNPLPLIGSCYGPEEGFQNLTCAEFEESERCYIKYCSTKDDKHLLELITALWRPLSQQTLQRVPYEEWEQKKLSFPLQVDKVSLQLINLWYSGCRRNLALLFPDVFEGDGQAEGTNDLLNFTRLIHFGAGSKNGTRKEIRSTLVLEFLFDCNLSIQNQKELEEKLKK